MNGKASGETDAIVWTRAGTRQHFRILVHSPGDRLQIVLYMRFAEVRRDFLQQIGMSALYRDKNTRVGTGELRGDNNTSTNPGTGRQQVTLPATGSFLTILSNLGTDRLLALLEAEEQRGTARTLAEPNVMAGNKEWGSFHAGGELPIPIAQSPTPGTTGATVTIVWRPFGVQMRFMGEIVSDSLIRLSDTLEVSDLDYTNAITLSGFSIPALRTRRVESTLDVRRNQSLIISGLYNNVDQRVKTGVPLLMNIPVLGALFSSQKFQRNETELIVVVTPVLVDPMRVRAVDVATPPDTLLPVARDALKRPAAVGAGAPIPPKRPR
jgi:pilus assembly protein CpaC